MNGGFCMQQGFLVVLLMAGPAVAETPGPSQPPAAAVAETLFVSDRRVVPLYAEPAEGPVARTVESGMTLTVLERQERFARVRDAKGEAWIETRYLAAEEPARAQLARAKQDLTAARNELAEVRKNLEKAQAAAAANAALASQAKAPATPAPSVPPPPPVGAESRASASSSVLPWLALSFAMLVIGFFAGRWWLRETIKRRSGGMYIRL